MSSAPEVRITGPLDADAELRFTACANPHALLFLQLHAGTGFPFVAQQDCGVDPLNHKVAAEKRRYLRRGQVVTVCAQGISPRTDHGHAVLKLEGVTEVIAHIPQPDQTGHSARSEA